MTLSLKKLIGPMCSITISESDRRFMRRAIELAQQVSEDEVSPNPRVGALIVESGEIVAEGFNPYDGGPHAVNVSATYRF